MRNVLAALVVVAVRKALCGTYLTRVKESRILVTIQHIVCVVPVLEYSLKDSLAASMRLCLVTFKFCCCETVYIARSN